MSTKKNLIRTLSDYFLLIVGLILILIGIPTLLLPPPFAFGIVLVALGFILTAFSKQGRNLWRYLREHWVWFGEKASVLHVFVHDKVKQRINRKLTDKLDIYSRMLIVLDVVLEKTKPKKL